MLDLVVYQIYPRSFQDSNGDGVGDLRGIIERLDHVAWLGADAIWLSPIHPSPMHDFGYDVADFRDIDPVFGTLDDFDALVDACHERGLKLLLDLVPCHTSIEHPWFRERPDFYVWRDGDAPPNNWMAAFGGSVWSRDAQTGRWYLHSFYPEQPDLDWRKPEVREAMGAVVRFWLDRGADGFRLDALDRLLKDPGYRDNPPVTEPFGLPLRSDEAGWARLHNVNAPDIGDAVGALRAAAGADALLIGEVYLPATQRAPYLEHLDAAFTFEVLHCAPGADALRAAIDRELATGKAAWTLSNHDFPRLADRVGAERVAAIALLHLFLPGMAFVFQGDEIGQADGPGVDPPLDRAGRDKHRHPIRWERDGGFTTGTPWLAVAEGESVAEQRERPGSLLQLFRRAIALRRGLPDSFAWLDGGDPEVLAFARGDVVVAINVGGGRAPTLGSEVLLASPRGDAVVARR